MRNLRNNWRTYGSFAFDFDLIYDLGIFTDAAGSDSGSFY